MHRSGDVGQHGQMASTGRSPHAVSYTCSVCGKETAANRRTGKLYGHHKPGDSRTCPGSGAQVIEPDAKSLPEEQQAHNKPGSLEYFCPDCGAKTRVNRRYGRLYSHVLPNTTEVCPASDRIMLEPEGGEPPKLERQDERPALPDATATVRPIQSSNSVRAIPAGLPSLGRRRR